MKDRDREDDRERGRDREDRDREDRDREDRGYEENGAPNGDDRKGEWEYDTQYPLDHYLR